MADDPFEAALAIGKELGLEVPRAELERVLDAPTNPIDRHLLLSLTRFHWIQVAGMLACTGGDGGGTTLGSLANA